MNKDLIIQYIKEKKNLFINKKGLDLKEVFEEIKYNLLQQNINASIKEGKIISFGMTLGGVGDYFSRLTPEILFNEKDVVIVYGEVKEKYIQELKEYIRNTNVIFVEVSDAKEPVFVSNYVHIEI